MSAATDPAATLRQLLKDGFDIGAAQAVIQAHADEPGHAAYRAAVPARDGDLECDPLAVVSVSEDGGAYVACWKWVYNSEAGQ